MSLISFFKDAGEKLFGSKEAEAATQQAQADAANAQAQAAAAQANQGASNAIVAYIASQNLSANGLSVAFDAAKGVVTVAGQAADQATKEKILLCCGNVRGVDKVDDQMTVATPADSSRYYTVVKGDTLSAISKAMYANANQYMKIFEANKPMLSHPDKIYPGQVLRIPA